MGLLKKLFDWLGKFFGSKVGKIIAKIMMGVGIGAGAGAGVEIGIAHKRLVWLRWAPEQFLHSLLERF